MAAGALRLAVLAPILLVLLATLYGASSAIPGKVSSGFMGRHLMGVQRNSKPILNCNDMSSESQCSKNPKCRWCRSDAIDDMCFSKKEALRLPQQVYSCNFN